MTAPLRVPCVTVITAQTEDLNDWQADDLCLVGNADNLTLAVVVVV